ncbi:glycosyl hydrolase [Paenibacillus campinasensis]|uniref:Beta-galactosidase n=1 Tax=Paenibacillus campinasensis TaxID=66347 RepID=A0A268EQ52_9BACL|nr:glycosyl hydrolase [Paenibacillus campinasensis]PAD75247.1 beta-galactosidase [Paenibacillus campinasensis]
MMTNTLPASDDIIRQFNNPAATYRPQPFWFLNHKLERQELEQQISAMHEQGVGGVVLHARHGMQAEYLSSEFMDALSFCTEECRKRGMDVWLYDEDNWPSGTLGGKLTRQHPEYRMRYLRIEERRYSAADWPKPLTLDFQPYDHNELIAILAYRAEEQGGEWLLHPEPLRITEQLGDVWTPGSEGDYVVLACWSCEIAEGMTFAGGYYLDTLNPEAVQTFIRLSYEPLLQLQQHYSSTIKGVFTDEPGLMIHDGFFGVEAIRTEVRDVEATLPGIVFAWTRGMEERYLADNGVDLIPLLGALLYHLTDGSLTARQQYYDTITRWYVEGYHGAIREWCERNGLLYIGHTLEEPVWGQARSQGNQTRVLQQFHYAGVDYLTAGIGSKDNPHRIVSVKTAASVAQLENKARVICESFGASGHAYSMRQRRLDANFMAFLGVNLFIPHAFYYSFAGYRKTDFPPTEFKHAPHWPHYRAFADYIGRLSLLGARTNRSPEVLLLSPIRTVYQDMFASGVSERKPNADTLFQLLSDRLLRSAIDYDYVDECQLAVADIIGRERPGFRFAERGGTYPLLVLPCIRVMSRQLAVRLLSFVQSGGTLIAVGTIPQDSESQHNDPELKRVMEQLFGEGGHGDRRFIGDGSTLFYSLEQAKRDNQDADPLESLCALLKPLLKQQPLFSYTMLEGGLEDLIVVERGESGRRYAWMMNWSEQEVAIRLDHRQEKGAAGERIIEEWRLEHGDVRAVRNDAVLTFSPGELRVFSMKEREDTVDDGGEAGSKADSSGTAARRFDRSDVLGMPRRAGERSKEIQLEPLWHYEADQPNVLLLDRWQVTLNDRQSKMNATMPGQVNTYHTTFHMTKELIEWLNARSEAPGRSPSRHRGVELVLDDVHQNVPSHIGFLQRRRNLEIFVNGVRQPALGPSSWQDPYYHSVEITSSLQPGLNELEILTVSLLEPMQEISFPAFLIGPFAVHGTALTVEPRQVAGEWCAEGYPFYAGTACYSQQLKLPRPGIEEQVWLEVNDIRETARLFVNDQDAGIRLWPPYRWDITRFIGEGMEEGASEAVTLRIQAANTLENLYGKRALPSGITGSSRIVYMERDRIERSMERD